ncbi:MAG: metallophosphoesterase [Chromatiaceae bacterium]|jgi:3',5'-cyclic AMP phosphodiesterase CpdA|nr:metallophosphoesterase [Chromatiaceae bacterium]
MNDIDRDLRERARVLRRGEQRADAGTRIDRRIFLHRSLWAGAAAGAASFGLFPLLNTIDMAFAQEGQSFRFAWISDTHLLPDDVNTRFVEKTIRAVQEVQAMDPSPDFLIFGGDLAQLGDPVELKLGKGILDELEIKKLFIPGEHDWYLDMGKTWVEMFGASPWKLDHKGVRLIGLDTVGQAPDYWSATNMSPQERMGHMATLDGSVAGAWAGLGDEQLKWLADAVADWPKDAPLVVFSHNPLYEYYPPWNFWVRDWRAVHEILAPFNRVTNLHGHTHQVLYNQFGKVRSIGMLATAWPWPYAPEGVPALTRCMVRANPGDHFDGVGWDKLAFAGEGVENEYVMWRPKEDAVFAQEPHDSGCADNINQRLHARVADRMWPY